MSYQLAAIRTDLPVTLDLEQARTEAFEPAKVEAIFRELEFLSLIDKLRKLTGVSSAEPVGTQQLSLFREASAQSGTPVRRSEPKTDLKTIVVDTPAELESLVRKLNAASVISFDTETTSTDEMTADLVGISLAVKDGEGYYLPVGHQAGVQLPLEQIISVLRGPLTDAHVPKIGHNLKYDLIMLARQGLRVAPLGFDTMIAEWVLDPGSRNLGLKNLAAVRLGESMTHIEELIGTGKNQRSMAEVSIADAAPYAAADAETTLSLKPLLESELKRFPKLWDLFVNIEMPLISVLAEMEMAGIALDKDFFAAFSVELSERLTALEKQVYAAVGKTFNINSTQQLSDVLFGTLYLTPPDRGRKTASGQTGHSAIAWRKAASASAYRFR